MLPKLSGLPGQGQRWGGGGGRRQGCLSPGWLGCLASHCHCDPSEARRRVCGSKGSSLRIDSKGGAISLAAEYDKPVMRWRLCAVHLPVLDCVGIGSRQQRRRHGSSGGTAELKRPRSQVSSKRARASSHAALLGHQTNYGYQPVPAKEFLGFLSFPPKGTPSHRWPKEQLFLACKRNSPEGGVEEFLHFLPLGDEGKERNQKECTT